MSTHICDCGERYSSSALVLACAERNHGKPRPDPVKDLAAKVEALEAENLQLWAAIGLIARRQLGDQESPIQATALRQIARQAQAKLER